MSLRSLRLAWTCRMVWRERSCSSSNSRRSCSTAALLSNSSATWRAWALATSPAKSFVASEPWQKSSSWRRPTVLAWAWDEAADNDACRAPKASRVEACSRSNSPRIAAPAARPASSSRSARSRVSTCSRRASRPWRWLAWASAWAPTAASPRRRSRCTVPLRPSSSCRSSARPARAAPVAASSAASSSPRRARGAVLPRSSCSCFTTSCWTVDREQSTRSSACASAAAKLSALRLSRSLRSTNACDRRSSVTVRRAPSSLASRAAALRCASSSGRETKPCSTLTSRASSEETRSPSTAPRLSWSPRSCRMAPRCSSQRADDPRASAPSLSSSASMRANSRCRSCSRPTAMVEATSVVTSSATMLRIVSVFFSRSSLSSNDSSTPTISRTVALTRSWTATSAWPGSAGPGRAAPAALRARSASRLPGLRGSAGPARSGTARRKPYAPAAHAALSCGRPRDCSAADGVQALTVPCGVAGLASPPALPGPRRFDAGPGRWTPPGGGEAGGAAAAPPAADGDLAVPTITAEAAADGTSSIAQQTSTCRQKSSDALP
mmetsp:Transcript_60102/g.188723  ORF Transcript_60102/g.188723 Transcript_60102/m.188723 type:complete len:553 (-) Transcript_60102:120-1778(-)